VKQRHRGRYPVLRPGDHCECICNENKEIADLCQLLSLLVENADMLCERVDMEHKMVLPLLPSSG
jgi:hypothetical protein